MDFTGSGTESQSLYDDPTPADLDQIPADLQAGAQIGDTVWLLDPQKNITNTNGVPWVITAIDMHSTGELYARFAEMPGGWPVVRCERTAPPLHIAPRPLLDAALAYAARGWHVFPCHTPTDHGCSCRRDCDRIGKHPRTQHGLKDATTDEATLQRWWTMWPTANIGIATGAVSGLVVLDEDSYKGGDQSRLDLEQSYSALPETMLQLTGGGGVQYFFAHPGVHVKNKVESLGVGLDIRGDGGYVIAPPSLHKSGTCYAWEVVHAPEDLALAPMPDWLLVLCQATARRDAPSAGELIPDGQRNDTLFKLGCSFRAKGCTEAVILAALRAMNTTQCQTPLSDGEVETIAASCAAYEPGHAQKDARQRQNGSTAHPPHDPDTSAQATTENEGPLPYSDYTNALAFVREHGQDLRYCYPWKSWLVWNGQYWERDMSGAVMRKAKHTVKRLARHAESLDDAQAKALMAHVKASLSTAKLKALVECAQSEPGIPVQPEALDKDAWALNCTNGTLNLETGDLRPHRQTDLITKCLPIPYDEAADCPRWQGFLWHIMGGTMTPDTKEMSMAELEQRHAADDRAQRFRTFLQRTTGYSLTGQTREQCMFMAHGSGSNGKSTYLETLQALLADYAQSTPSASLLAKDRHDGIPNDIARLRGARLVTAVEIGEGKRLDEELIKRLTGQDTLTARFLNAEFFDFKAEFKLFVACNHLPNIRGVDHAIWRRIKRIPFTVTIPDANQDKTLPAALREELPGILCWAVQGCLDWQHDGLAVPAEVQAATKDYRAAMDVVGRFIEECCLVSPEVRVKGGEVYAAYKQWCDRSNEYAITLTAFGNRLEEKGFQKQVSGGVWRLGIGLLSTTEGGAL